MAHCNHFHPSPLNRRDMLARCAQGFGSVAFMAMFGQQNALGSLPTGGSPLVPRRPHHAPRAKNVIFLYMDGGPAQMDTFDPKPKLAEYHGKPFPMKMEPTQFNDNGNTLAGPWEFRKHGQSGLEISSLFPHVAQSADDLCVVRSMVSEFSEHTNANYFLHTGLGLAGRPSAGSWVSYGLGTENQNFPGFVVLNGGLIPPGGLPNFGSGFLPATYQGSIFKAGDPPVANIQPLEADPQLQRGKLSLLAKLDAASKGNLGSSDAVESAIANYELAFRMQSAVPELMDLRGETEATKRMYGFDHAYEPTRIYARQCLTARRLVERGVRFIELTCPQVGGDRWDQHSKLKEGHNNNARAVDQPIGALLKDLKGRGLLDETLVIWGGEFGRTPFSQGKDGRDHNPFAFSMWLAGGGIKGGITHGVTDDFGYKVVADRVEIFDLHATMLHLLGIDHERLTVRFSGRDMRLTDVHGHVMKEWLV
ncbi:MAG TPA: DUF1501 domain-containing protein [Verrucomicrobiales bacterium]|nr:DUF1501 domain-containing protein [Verrucomicrobiales bacterium]